MLMLALASALHCALRCQLATILCRDAALPTGCHLSIPCRYLLHVRLRHAAVAIPGSPFKLTVLPAPAHAKATRLPVLPVGGRVGLEVTDAADAARGGAIGARLVMRTADKMGNFCTSGGANV